MQGKHTRGTGIRSDAEKQNFLVVNGWRPLVFTSDMLRDDPDSCIELVKTLIKKG